ncbi:MAG: hypothetical protein OHK0057_03960 [Thermoflexibacter sp.]
MKYLGYILIVISVIFYSCASKKARTEEVVPIVNLDSIKCMSEWQNFQLQQDTIFLLLKYQEPYIIESGKDKLTITVVDIIDDCSEESAKITYGCKVEVILKLQLNNKCEYVTKYPISVSRYSLKNGLNSIKQLYCNFLNSSVMIFNEPMTPHLLLYNIMATLWQVAPFTNTEKERLEISKNKGKYEVSIYLQKRCF